MIIVMSQSSGGIGGSAHATGTEPNKASKEYGVSPVVCLKTNIQTIGKNNGIWQLNVLTGTASNTQQSHRYLIDEVNVGDYVNYSASEGLTSAKTYTTQQNLTGTTQTTSTYSNTERTFSSSENLQWRVLSKNEATGEINLMSSFSTSLALRIGNSKGYINSEDILNNISKIYGYGYGAIGGRSMKMEDILQYSTYTPSAGTVKTYTSGNYFIEVPAGKSGYGDVTGGTNYTEDGVTYKKATTDAQVTTKMTYYKLASSTITDEIMRNMIFVNSTNYWLASRCVSNWGDCGYYVRVVINQEVTTYGFCYSTNKSYESNGSYVRPVVSLKANIETTGKTGDIYGLK